MKSKLYLLVLVALLALAMIAGCADDAPEPAPADDEEEAPDPTPVDDEEEAEAPGEIETYTVVGLYPFTGPLSTFAENNAAAASLAADDINEWLEAEGKNWRLRLEFDDTQTEGPVALRKMQSWYGDGVEFFAGPMASGATQECLSFANANQIFYISPSSTSPALGIADDWLFRFCTDDFIQGPAIARIAAEAGATHVIFGWRGDTWGDGLQGAAQSAIEDLGLEVYPEKLRYDPLKEDFATDLALLDSYVSDLVGQGVALENIAFNLIAFEEAAPFMNEAAGYDQLAELVWIGSDGTAYSEAVRSHPVASVFANEVKFVNTMNRLPEEFGAESNHERVKEHISETLGRDTDAYSYNSYDIIWAFALLFDEVGYDTAAARDLLPSVIDEWSQVYGASGHIVLNEFGDRAFADYDIIMLNDDLEWTVPGFYDGGTDAIVWTEEIY